MARLMFFEKKNMILQCYCISYSSRPHHSVSSFYKLSTTLLFCFYWLLFEKKATEKQNKPRFWMLVLCSGQTWDQWDVIRAGQCVKGSLSINTHCSWQQRAYKNEANISERYYELGEPKFILLICLLGLDTFPHLLITNISWWMNDRNSVLPTT